MNNNEKLESIIRMVNELGLSGDDVVSYLVEKGKLNPNNSTDSPQATSVRSIKRPEEFCLGCMCTQTA